MPVEANAGWATIFLILAGLCAVLGLALPWGERVIGPDSDFSSSDRLRTTTTTTPYTYWPRGAKGQAAAATTTSVATTTTSSPTAGDGASFNITMKFYIFGACSFDWKGNRFECHRLEEHFDDSAVCTYLPVIPGRCFYPRACTELQGLIATCQAMAVLSILFTCFSISSMGYTTCALKGCECGKPITSSIVYTIIAIAFTVPACLMTQRLWKEQQGDGCSDGESSSCCYPPISSFPDSTPGFSQWLFAAAAGFQVSAIIVAIALPRTLCSEPAPTVPTSFTFSSDDDA